MFDFIIDMIADIAELFVDLWVNKVINRKKKVISILIVQVNHRGYKMENKMERINELLEMPCFIMDYLPEQVEPDNGGQFFDVEYYLLNSDKHTGLKDRFVALY